jgi:translation initiation factor 1A
MPKKKSKHRNVADREKEEAVVFKAEDQYYANVTKSLGGGRFDLECDDGVQRIGKLRGNMRKSQWVSVGCIVLVSLRDFEGDAASGKADILLKYSDSAAKHLQRYGELDWLLKKARCDSDNDEDDDIEFDVDLV